MDCKIRVSRFMNNERKYHAQSSEISQQAANATHSVRQRTESGGDHNEVDFCPYRLHPCLNNVQPGERARLPQPSGYHPPKARSVSDSPPPLRLRTSCRNRFITTKDRRACRCEACLSVVSAHFIDGESYACDSMLELSPLMVRTPHQGTRDM